MILLRKLRSKGHRGLHSIARLSSSVKRSVALTSRLFWSAYFNEAYLKEFTELYLSAKVNDWHQRGRLSDEQAARLLDRSRSPAVVEYLKGFIVHLGLNIFEPPFLGNIAAIFLTVIFEQPAILLILFIVPILRTIYTLSRMIRNRGNGISLKTALVLGTLPKVGVVAYPVQMATAHPNLSRLLAQWQMSNIACHVPLVGGADSRLEHFCIKTADFGASLQYKITDLLIRLKMKCIGR